MSLREDKPAPCFDFREDKGGWSIYDARTGAPVVLNSKPQVDLSLNEADELTSLLNRVECRESARRYAREG